MHPVLVQLGTWLDDAFEEVRVNSVGHLVVPLAGDPPFMVGVDDAGIHGAIVEVHVPFLTAVPETPALFQVVAMNQDLAPLGHVRAGPDPEPAETWMLELRYRLGADGLTQHSIVQLGLRLNMIAKTVRDKLQPTFGGVAVVST